MGKSSLYSQLILKSSEEKKEEEVSFQEESAKLQLASDILATEKSLSEAKRNRIATITQRSFDSAAIIYCDRTIEALEEGVKRLKALQVELF